jgi:Ankyrin repeats (3 copies)
VHTRQSKNSSRATWAITSLEAGAASFAGGLVLLYLNPYWHFDDGGFLDWRVHWWDAACEILVGAGLVILALALLASIALIVSRLCGGQLWPYGVNVLIVVGTLTWVSFGGFVSSLDAHFEWNAADGFPVFRLQSWDESAGLWRPAGNSVVQWFVQMQLQPVLRGYFSLNDWRKMNGDVSLKVGRILPVAWPVALGYGGDTLEDPDETALMKAAVQGDTKSLQQLLSASNGTDVNALDQGAQSALILACESPKPNVDVVKALLAANANVNLRSRNGYTALTWALTRNNREIIRLLRKAGAKP